MVLVSVSYSMLLLLFSFFCKDWMQNKRRNVYTRPTFLPESSEVNEYISIIGAYQLRVELQTDILTQTGFISYCIVSS